MVKYSLLVTKKFKYSMMTSLLHTLLVLKMLVALSQPYTRRLLSLATRQHLLFVRAAHEISNATFYKLLENRQPVYFQATCRMYNAIFPCAARTNNNVAVSPTTKVAPCMVDF